MALKAAVKTRRHFSDEFKADAVRRILNGGESISSVGRDLKISTSVMVRWVNKFSMRQLDEIPTDLPQPPLDFLGQEQGQAIDSKPPVLVQAGMLARLERLQAENTLLKREVNALKIVLRMSWRDL